MMQYKLLVMNLIMVLSIILICIIGDKLVERTRNRAWLKAIFDNVTHGIVGVLASAIVVVNFKDRIPDIEVVMVLVFAYVMSSAIDVDHFIEARSFHIHDATNLTHRAFLHNSSITLIIFIFLLYTNMILRPFKFSLWVGVFFISFATHHLRDATRRGLWFPPFGSTRAIPYVLYIAFIIATPYVVDYFLGLGRLKPILTKPLLV